MNRNLGGPRLLLYYYKHIVWLIIRVHTVHMVFVLHIAYTYVAYYSHIAIMKFLNDYKNVRIIFNSFIAYYIPLYIKIHIVYETNSAAKISFALHNLTLYLSNDRKKGQHNS